jgi:hypothetical protein
MGEDEEGEMGTTCLHAVVDGRFQYGRIRVARDISFYRFTGNRHSNFTAVLAAKVF